MFHRNESLLRDGTGLAVAGATVTVYVNGTDTAGNYTNATKATLYSANSAIPGNVIANPVTTDINGDYDYYVADGIYDEVARYGSITEVRPYIQMFDPFEASSAFAAASAALGLLFLSLFTAAPTKNIPIGTDAVQTNGYATAGRGAASYVYDATVDAAYVAAHPRSSFVSANGRGFKLAERVVDPTMFGGVPYNPAAEVDSSDPLQGFFDHAKDPQTARATIFNWSDDWMVSKTIYATYWDGAEPNVDRNFICGSLRLAPLASLPGGVPLPYALEIAGFRHSWVGLIGIHEAGPTQYSNTIYATRRCIRGVHIRSAANSTFGDIAVDGSRRDAVHLEGWEAGFTVNGVVFPTANSIGCKIGRINGRFCGSSYLYAANQAPANLTATGTVYGRNTGAAYSAEVFDATTAGQEFAESQRTKITVGAGTTTGDLQVNDRIWRRAELTPTNYGTISAASTGTGTGTFTWTAGDPTNIDGLGNGLQVGDYYPMFQAGGNVGKEFIITGFSGGSNRVVAVAKADPDGASEVTAHAATADPTYQQFGRRSWHWVSQVIDATNFTVDGWLPAATNSAIRIVVGAAFKCEGDDTANVSVAGVIALLCGLGWQSKGNFAPRAGTVLAESCPVGIALGDPSYGGHNGIHIAHGHLEGCEADVMSGSHLISGTLNIQSLIDKRKFISYSPRGAINEMVPSAPRMMGQALQFIYSGTVIEPSPGGVRESYSGILLVTNATTYRKLYIHSVNPTITVGYDRPEADLYSKHHWAEVVLSSGSGGQPGTATFNLDTTLVALGWTFAGVATGTSYVIANPLNPLKLYLYYLAATKKVMVLRSSFLLDSSGNIALPGNLSLAGGVTGPFNMMNGGAGGVADANNATVYFGYNGSATYRHAIVTRHGTGASAGIDLYLGDSGNPNDIPTNKVLVIDAVNGLQMSKGITTSAGKIGYATGAGNVVVQGTSRTTAVTLNKVTGKITLFSTTTTAGQTTTFTWNNSQLGATDTIGWAQLSGAGVYFVSAKNNGDGTAAVSVYTPAAVGAGEAPAFQFNIIQGVQS